MAKNKINIEIEDLTEDSKKIQPRVFPGLSAEGLQSFHVDMSRGKSKKNIVSMVSEGATVTRGTAGLIGGAVAWIVSEVIQDQDRAMAESVLDVYLATIIWVAIFGIFTGGALRASEDIYAGKTHEAPKSFFLGALAGLVSGIISGIFAQLVYGILGGGLEENVLVQIFARSAAFGIAGVLLGLGISLPYGIQKKIKAAALGGLLGGLVGGLLFDTLGSVLGLLLGGGGEISRLIGLAITGMAIGLGMAATENAYRDVWLQVIAGPFKGKQFILFKNVNWIGRHPSCEIVLVKDQFVADQHCQLIQTPNGYRILVNAFSGAQVFVNNQLITDKFLQPEDVIQIGQSAFQFKANTN